MRGLIIILFLVSACTLHSAAEPTPEEAALNFQQELEEVSEVRFFFLSRTGQYSVSSEQLIEESTVQILRRCGNNCVQFMKEIVDHLKASTLTNCELGQQNILIEWAEGASLVYSFSGRMIRFEGACYFNEHSIRSVIKGSGFIFE